MVTQLAVKARRKFKTFEYIRILETTKAGWPHYHLLVIAPYIPQAWLSSTWAELTGARIVDVRIIKKGSDVYFYVLKYLSKQKKIPWTNRRISWSKKFFPEDSKPKGYPLGLTGKTFLDKHPHEVIAEEWQGLVLRAFNKDIVYDARDSEKVIERTERMDD